MIYFFMKGEKIFLYGILVEAEIQRQVLGRVLENVPDKLFGYKRSQISIENEEYPVIVPDPSSSVSGIVVNVDEIELSKIDEYETTAYKREKVKLESNAEVWVYIAR